MVIGEFVGDSDASCRTDFNPAFISLIDTSSSLLPLNLEVVPHRLMGAICAEAKVRVPTNSIATFINGWASPPCPESSFRDQHPGGGFCVVKSAGERLAARRDKYLDVSKREISDRRKRLR